MADKLCGNCFQPTAGAGPCPHCGYDEAADAGRFPLALAVGSVLNGRYILGRTLGQGGFGITYVAQDVQTGQRVAIKEYFPETMVTRTQGHTVSAFSGQRQENFLYGKQCFLAEAQTLAQFNGVENIVGVHSYFEENGTAYFVMEFVDGVSFQKYLHQMGGKVSWEEVKSILFPIMDALSIVHSQGIIHRDISPDNICITRNGTTKLLDFGAARYSLGDRSRSLDVVLKAGYAPKEQYTRRGRQGPYTDVYSMAATFYYALTRRLPPESVDREEEDDLILPSSLGIRIPADAEAALEKGLAVRAADRYQTMEEFRRALSGGDAGWVQEPVPRFWTPEPPIPERPMERPVTHPQSSRPVTHPQSGQPVSQPQNSQPASQGSRPVSGGIQPVLDSLRLIWKKFLSGQVCLFGKSLPLKVIVPAAVLALVVVAGAFLLLGGKDGPTVQKRPHSSATEEPVETVPETYPPLELEITPVVNKIIAIGYDFTAAICSDGTVVTTGDISDLDTSEWTDIISLAAGSAHLLGLKENGTVVSAGFNYKESCSVEDWSDVIDLLATWDHTVGLTSSGRVLATGENEFGQCDTDSWRDIVAIAVGDGYTVGLRSDGTVVAVGDNKKGQCDTGSWRDIVAISAEDHMTAGLRSDGTVVVTGSDTAAEATAHWGGVVAIDVYYDDLSALRADGTVLSTVDWDSTAGAWSGITSIFSNTFCFVGLREDGTLMLEDYDLGQADVDSWSGIVDVYAGYDRVIGITEYGYLLAAGENDAGQCDVYGFEDIRLPELPKMEFTPINRPRTSYELVAGELGEEITDPPGYEMKLKSLAQTYTYYYEGEAYTITDYEYDSQGNLMKEHMRYPGDDGSTSYMRPKTTEYEYGPYGNPLKGTTFTEGESTPTVKQYFYYSDARKCAEWDPVYGTLTICTYDDQGYLTEERRYDQYGFPEGGTKYENDEDGYAVKVITLNEDGSLSDDWWEYERDKDGKVLSRTVYTDGEFDYRETNTFNEHGHLIESVAPDSHETYVYTYDKQGNILTRKCYSNDVPLYEYTYIVMEVPVWEW